MARGSRPSAARTPFTDKEFLMQQDTTTELRASDLNLVLVAAEMFAEILGASSTARSAKRQPACGGSI
jgi:hypothetical protein